MLDALLLWLGAIAVGFVLLNQGAKFVTVVAATMLLDGNLTQYEGVALIALFVPYVLNLAISQRTGPAEEIRERIEDLEIGLAFTGWIFGRKVVVRAGLKWLVFGILWSVMGAQFLVQGAIGLSNAMGLNPWFIGITVVALGTSLPDIAAAWHATRLGYTDLVLREGIGASVVTTLLTLGMIGILRPASHSVELLLPVVGAMVFTSFLLLALILGGWRITSRSGAVLTSSYFAMVAFNILWLRGGFP